MPKIHHETIRIRNIFHMLAYSVDGLSRQSLMERISTEEFENLSDLFAEILGDLISRQVKRGLSRDYLVKTDDILTVRGRVLLGETIKNRILRRRQISVEFDDLSEDNLKNKIIKTSIDILIKSNISPTRRKKLSRLKLFFSGVNKVDLRKVEFSRLKNERDKNYSAILIICQFLAEGMLIAEKNGKNKVQNFLTERVLSRIFEEFLREFFRRHFSGKIKVSKRQIGWNVTSGNGRFLPKMEADVFLQQGEKVAILDAKFYRNIFSKSQFSNSEKMNSANLYQIFSYVKNFCAQNPDLQVSGGLIYAKTSEDLSPNEKFSLDGNIFIVRSIDLDCEFSIIKSQLFEIMAEIFEI